MTTMSNAQLEIMDGNYNYLVWFEDTIHGEKGKCVAVRIENTTDCREDCKVPKETTIIIGEKEAKYLLSWLKTFVEV